MKNFSFLFAAFSATWFVFFWYLFSIWRKQRRIERGIQHIMKQFQKKP
ncbi:hypothetical protein CSA56_00760 [candidate division KSB3 bacterium]|uniref:CcmD family protein n=1 Tax=candidate division KSB3 bacterium TaxID=2044937 RepID=A0A2G6KLI5_9BACT|nr:MAG: hypothetical protein CSA56_00760 [candidate division KSB3 bacterium]